MIYGLGSENNDPLVRRGTQGLGGRDQSLYDRLKSGFPSKYVVKFRSIGDPVLHLSNP
jgi:hypothetical protein